MDMENIRRRLLRQQVSRSRQQRPEALQSSILRSISTEILLCILNHLPTPSAVAFSITCYQIYHKVGNQHLKTLASQPEGIITFLKLLTPDLPDSVFCAPCQKLHSMGNAARYIYGGSVRKYTACLSSDLDAFVNVYIGYRFSSTVFEMAMKYHRYNPECDRLLKILSEKREIQIRSNCIRQSRAECRIIQDRMIQRSQMEFLSIAPFKLEDDFDSLGFIMDRAFEICQHLKYRKENHEIYVETTFGTFNDHGKLVVTRIWTVTLKKLPDLEIQNISSGIIQCLDCWTEFRIDFVNHQERGAVLIFTRWKDLGTGPDDEVWKRHLRPRSGYASKIGHFRKHALSSVSENFEPSPFLSAENETEMFQVRDKWLSTS